jgi:NAD(P)-dependent dehydrogenase (short-subunit alcohol dehydrogenase family)
MCQPAAGFRQRAVGFIQRRMTTNTSRIALVTGGSRGLGRSMALHLAERGVGTLLTYHRNAGQAREVVAEVERRGARAIALQLDAGDSASYPAFVDRVRAALAEGWGTDRIHYLVNNAGVGGHAPFLETTEALFDELVRVHLKATLFLTQRLAPLVADGGAILNVSTGLARFTLPGYAAYAAMKGGVEVLTRYMAKELGARDITVNTIAPGAIETDFGGGAVRDNPELNKMIASTAALGRVGLPDDIGRVVAFLLSPDSHWITGQRLEVAGGAFL